MRAALYWMLLNRFLTMAASWLTSPAARWPKRFFIWAQAPPTAWAPDGWPFTSVEDPKRQDAR